MKLSERVRTMHDSPIRMFDVLAEEAVKNGKKIYKVNIGQPDIDTPKCFMEAIKAFDSDVIGYSDSRGELVLREAISDYFKQYNMNFEPEDVLITNGGSEALSMVFSAILDPLDEVLLPEPFYTNYHTFISSADGVIRPLTTSVDDGYNYAKRDLIENNITKRTKAICCTSPRNPTGRVLSFDDVQLICDLAIEYDLWIVADEVYRELVFDGRNLSSFGMIPEAADRVIIVDSVSKRFSACGARVGCIVTKNKDIIAGTLKMAHGRLSCPTVDQIGATALYRLDKSFYDIPKREYEERRNAFYEEIRKIDGITCKKPGGALYMTLRLPIKNAEDFLVYLLTEFEDNGETVMFAPAEGFYASPRHGRDEIRVAYVLNSESMRRSAELIRLGLESYMAKNRQEIK